MKKKLLLTIIISLICLIFPTKAEANENYVYWEVGGPNKALKDFFSSDSYKYIKHIVFTKTDNPGLNHGDDNSKYDVSKQKDKSVIIIPVISQSDDYTMYIEYNGTLVFNKDSSNIFWKFDSLEDIHFDSIDTSQVTDMHSMFLGLSKLTSLDLTLFNTSQVTDMHSMFGGCQNLININLISFDTSNVVDMSYMFANCKKLQELNLSAFNTSSVENMNTMFMDSTNITELDLTSFNTSKVSNMSGVFSGLRYVKTIYVSELWNTDNVSNSENIFSGCISLTGMQGTKFTTTHESDITYARIDTKNKPGYLSKKIEVSEIEIEESFDIEIGETKKIKVTIYPSDANYNKNISWVSSNNDIASVNNEGEVHAIDIGTTIITATTNSGVQATCVVKVIEKSIDVEKIILNKTEIELNKGKAYKLEAIIIPENATDRTIEWSSSNSDIVKVDEQGNIETINEGTATITATTTNEKQATCMVTVTPKAKILYTTHVQNIGWQEYVSNGEMAGTSGQSLRLEGIKIKLENAEYSGDVEYKTHIQNIGWEKDYKKNDEMSGTSGKSLRLEAIQIRLTGEMAEHYDIYYRVHAQMFGWLGWARNGEQSGTSGYGYRLEGIEIVLVEKGTIFDEYGDKFTFVDKTLGKTKPIRDDKLIAYTTHVQNVGWQEYVTDGDMAGTSGKSLRLEGIRIKLNNQKYSGNIEYKTHIQNIGWEKDYKKNDEMSGTSGKSLRLEAIQIKLTGEMAEHYDVYYRVHAQMFGWLNWAKNGESSGTEGYGYRLEGIEIVLINKGEQPPERQSNSDKSFIEK